MKLKILVYLSLSTLFASLSAVTHAQTYSLVTEFNGSDGGVPMAGVTVRGGALWGTTSTGSINGSGTAY
jgi:hypothetical protein